MRTNITVEPTDWVSKESHFPSLSAYQEQYKRSITEPADFWHEAAQRYHWNVAPSKEKTLSYNMDPRKGKVFFHWFEDGMTNLAYNCLDRHIRAGNGDKIAFKWIGNEPEENINLTYTQLHEQVLKLAVVLKSLGVEKGSRVAIYMPMIPELPITLLACARIGAIHSVVFGGFSAHSLASRISDIKCNVILTCDYTRRGPKLIELKSIASQAMDLVEKNGLKVAHCLVVKRFADSEDLPHTEMTPGRDRWYHELMDSVSASEDSLEWMNAEDVLFILYTSGSTGKPKGIVHTTGGYMVYAGMTSLYTFDLQPHDVFFCTADIGWITGHSYVVYGPLLNGVTSLIFEGLPVYPGPDRLWQIVNQHRVTKFYTAPTAIRALIKLGDEPVEKHSRDTIKVLGTVGEPIDPNSWKWYHQLVGNGRCSVVDTFWQTETGGHMITCLPGATPMKPGSAGLPFFGVVPDLLIDDTWRERHVCSEDDDPEVRLKKANPRVYAEVKAGLVKEGCLVFSLPWPGIARSVWGDHARFESTYFQRFPGHFMTGDGCFRDQDGYYWITGRIDDMLNVSGHLMSTAQVEGVLLQHEKVAECAVVPKPHPEKGQCMFCFVVMRDNHEYNEQVHKELVIKIREEIGPIATPDKIQVISELPKTRSGKVMRRILAKFVTGMTDVGDVSTLANMAVLDELKKALNLN
ncbi:Acetyl-coenzyme A synthetase, cytoplasmic [Cichlidogyrus casuarinus]|uniref:Acetyl-coenzyme A synthetase n=1 Tax=Cichlidogyrus casuarinus TaxID=1844966 RepID=A0ABD2Q7Y7_9PLAT